MSPRAKQFRTYLESLRAPVAEMAGLPVEAVAIYAQQNIMEHVGSAIAQAGGCAVLLGVSGWDGAGNDERLKDPAVQATLEVSVWTPEVLTTGDDGPTSLDVAEDITHGLHGYEPTGGSPGRTLIPEFRRGGLRLEKDDNGSWLVASLTFNFKLRLRRRPAPHDPVPPTPSRTADSTTITADSTLITADMV